MAHRRPLPFSDVGKMEEGEWQESHARSQAIISIRIQWYGAYFIFMKILPNKTKNPFNGACADTKLRGTSLMKQERRKFFDVWVDFRKSC